MAVKIPTYEDRLSPSGFVTPQARATEVSGAVGAGLQNLGNAGMTYAAHETAMLRKQEEDNAIGNISKPLAEQDGYWPNRVATLAQQAQNGGLITGEDGQPVPMSQVIRSEFDAAKAQFMANVTNKKAALLASQHLDRLWANTYQTSLATEAKLNVQNRTDNLDASVASWSSQAAADDTKAEGNILSAKTIIANSGLDEHTRNLKALAAEKSIVEAAVGGAIKRNAPAVVAALQSRFGMGQPDATGGLLTHDGLPARRNADGSYSTEVSITVTDPKLNNGKPTNIPSLWGGKEVDEQTAVDNALKSGKTYSSYNSIDEAVTAAKARSNAGGAGAGPDFATIWKAQTNQESGSKQFKPDGVTPVTSPKGALGIAQVMPGTGPEAAKLAGLPWDLNRLKTDGAYNEQLGQAYMKKQLETFGGDTAKALAAYNMGPGDAKKGNGVTGLVAKYGDQWLSHAPQETQNYVATIMGRTGSTSGSTGALPSTPKVPVPSGLQALVDKIEPDRLHAFMGEANTEVNRGQAVYRSQIQTTEGDHVTAFMNGQQVQKPLTEQDYKNAYGPIDGPQRFANYKQIWQMGTDINTLKMTPVAQQDAVIERYKADPSKPGYELATKRYDAMIAAKDKLNTERASDPIRWAQSNQLADAKPLNWNDITSKPDELSANLSKRAGIATTMNQIYGTPYQLLSKDEASKLATGFNSMTAEGKISYLSLMAKAVTSPEAQRSIFNQIAPDSPLTAMAGKLYTESNSTTIPGFFKDRSYNPQMVATTILKGEAILNPTKADKAQDGKSTNLIMPKETDMHVGFADQTKGIFVNQPGSADRLYQAAKAYYAAKSAQEGDYSGSLNSSRWSDAVDAVVGGISSVNGGKVRRPWGVDETQFKDKLFTAFNQTAQANGLTGKMANFRDFTFEATPSDTYLVRNGSGYVTGADGRALIVSLTGPVQPPAAPVVAPTVAPSARPNTQQPKTK
jgi:hypothetical protein